MRRKLSVIGIILVLALTSVFVMAVPASAADAIDIIAPLGATPDTQIIGTSVEVIVDVEVDVAGYHNVGLAVVDDITATPPTAVGGYSETVYLNVGHTTLSRLVPLGPGITANVAYDVTAALDGTVATDAEVDAVNLIDLNATGATITTTLAGKGVVLLEAILDQFVTPSDINDELLQTGDVNDALTNNGLALVQDVGNLVPPIMGIASDGVDIAGGVVAGVKGSVVTNVPPIVDGVLSVAKEIIGLFSTSVTIAP